MISGALLKRSANMNEGLSVWVQDEDEPNSAGMGSTTPRTTGNVNCSRRLCVSSRSSVSAPPGSNRSQAARVNIASVAAVARLACAQRPVDHDRVNIRSTGGEENREERTGGVGCTCGPGSASTRATIGSSGSACAVRRRYSVP